MRLAPRLVMTALAAAAAAGCGDDGDDGAFATQAPEDAALIRLSSPAFIDGSRLQQKYTCDGAGEEPVVEAGTVPPSTKELVVTVIDPDAGSFVHLTRYALSPRGSGSVSEGGTEGANGKGTAGWTPPCPQRGDEAHRYVWTVYALRDPSKLPPRAEPADVARAVDDDILARGTITALFGRR